MIKNANFYGIVSTLGNRWNNPVHVPPKIRKYTFDMNKTFYKNNFTDLEIIIKLKLNLVKDKINSLKMYYRRRKSWLKYHT